jgi:serine/threonine protein kinase
MDSEKQKKRQDFYRRETDHLREMRVLKTVTMESSSLKGIVVEGYDVVKILGKGSFGVVRLVREKRENAPTVIQSPFDLDSKVPPPLASRSVSRDMTSEILRNIEPKKEVYAMKVIRKSEMLRNSQEGHIWAERDFLVASEGSKWIVPLVASFQDSHNLYLVMEFMIGGDFLGLLIRKDRLHESATRFYMAEMILCIEEAHAMNWIHRDIKPDNFLITASGHLKISDFGLAFDGHWTHDQGFHNNYRYRLLERLDVDIEGDGLDKEARKTVIGALKLASAIPSRSPPLKQQNKSQFFTQDKIIDWRNQTDMRSLAASMVGTSQYMAPEIIRGEFYDGRCDWWSMGCIMYECLYGRTPFCADDRTETKARILHHKETLHFPASSGISADAISLISALLSDREPRLSSGEYVQNDIIRRRIDTSGGAVSMSDYLQKFREQGGHFVYANDAAEIKAHPFFDGVNWKHLSSCTAPWIPRCNSAIDTRYFDEGTEISEFAASEEDVDKENIDPLFESPVGAEKLAEWYRNAIMSPSEMEYVSTLEDAEIEQHEALKLEESKKRPKKRPRDIILRDVNVGKEALAIRKKAAFLGYTYKRPRGERVTRM